MNNLNFEMNPLVEKVFEHLCIGYSYNEKKYIKSVADILTSHKKTKLALVVINFISNNPRAYKFIDLVRYIRFNRDRLFPNNYKKSNQKMVRIGRYTRTTSISFYIIKHLNI